MRLLRYAMWMLVGTIVIAEEASSQDYPRKPIRMVTAEAGGGADFAARVISRELSGPLGQPVVVDNRGASGGIIAIENVAKSPPDGYTVLLFSNGMWTQPLLLNVSYDPVRDFSPITLADRLPNILVVHPSLPAKTAKELVALARARPGELNYSSSSTGSTPHLAAELFKALAGVNIVRIPYKGTGTALNALIGGQVQIMFPNPAAVMAHVRSGRLRALAVTTAQSFALLPDLPPLSDAVPGYEAESNHSIFAPAGTPRPIIDRLNQEIVRVLNRPDVRERFSSAGVEVVGNSPEELAATMKSEMARLGKMIKDAGIHE
jgi:tripartite-type tricarboxylate transporter receptor subunit TctC